MAQQQEINVKKIAPIAVIVLALIFIVIFWSRMTVTVEAGHAGVLFKTFMGGVDTEKTYEKDFILWLPGIK